MKVLLIEPDVVLGSVYAQALADDGHAVQMCRTAQSAVMDCDSNQPDCIVMEVQLPRHNGIEFLYEFRSYPEWQHIPVILLSNVPPKDLLSPVLWNQLNVQAYLYKPRTSLKAITAALRNVLLTV